ncbi:MAG: NgoPII family restriction endonuclease [Clostridium sp.]|nr:NgoPII family restriction endonuclease [Clostridium sp.]
MSTNVLVALNNLMKLQNNELIEIYRGTVRNRVNSVGDALEYYIKDLFCSSIDEHDFAKKDLEYSKYLSYLGGPKNPPDFIIRKSSAVEVKKIEGITFGKIALNSSYPKDTLSSSSTLITKACRECENEFGGWTRKDMIYAIGNVLDNKLRVLWLLDGGCYCADEEVYNKIKSIIKDGVGEINGVEFADSKELGRVNKVDPLQITDLRIRGMWNISHPMNVFDYLVDDYNRETNLQVYCLMLKNKYDKICDNDKNSLREYIKKGKLIKQDIKIKNPNNPAKFIDAILYKASL